MKFTFIRNATVILDYAGKHILIDPMLAEKDRYPGLPGTVHSERRFPRVELPFDARDIIKNVDAIFLSHTHPDHWDEVATGLIDKEQKIFVQNEKDKEFLESQGFKNLAVLPQKLDYENGIHVTKTLCQHGSNEAFKNHEVGEVLGHATGFIFEAPNEPTLYFAGDTIWIDAVENNLKQYKPEVVVLHAGDAQLQGFGSIIMGKEDVVHAHKIAPQSKLVAIHMEACNHAVLSRKELRSYVDKAGIGQSVIIPLEGDKLEF